MATVNKNFVIKNGLVVQGSTATINGNSILTQNAGDAYILNLVGGATLVKSVDSLFTVDQAGNLTLNYGTGLTKTSNNLVIDRSTVDTWYDASGSAASAQSAAESYADSQISSAITTLGNQTSTDISNAITTAENYTDAAISQEVTDRNNAISSALTTAENYADQVGTAAENYADMAATNAENAAKSYADGLASNYDPAGSAATAQSNAESYADSAVSTHNSQTTNVHGIANTANLATKNYADNSASSAQSAAESYADTAASNAQSAAQSYADGLASNYDAAGSAASAETNANSYTDTAISNGNSTAEPQYKGIKYSWYSEDTANYAWANSDSTVTAMSWNTNYASAKVIIRLRNGNHSQVSEVLVTLDSSNNIHMTEYAVVTTNGSLGDISASISGSNVNLLVTPTHNTGTDIVTHATLMAWGD